MQVQTTVLQVESINSNMLLAAVSDLLDRKLAGFQPPSTNPKDQDFITRVEVAEMFKISLPTVHAWTNAGILKAYKLANKTRYKRGEVQAAAVPFQKGGKHE